MAPPTPGLARSGDTSNGTPLSANWTNLSEPLSPSARAEATFTWATFGGLQVGVLFGGRGNYSVLDDDTWLFENGTWRELNLSVHPSVRRGAMAAFDPVDGYVVLFGGSSGTAYENDTWVFDGHSWAELVPPVSPPARRVGGFAWDASDGYLLLFSGHNGTSLGINANFTTIDDTWTFLHGRWTQIHPPLLPLGRSEPSEVYDTALGEIVLYGGYTTQPSYLAYNDTWVFHAGVWTEVNRSVAPSPRDGAPMAYDPSLHMVVLEGGQNETGNSSTLELNDTWVLEGNTTSTLVWVRVTVAHKLLAADSASMVFDPELNTVLVFGGHSGLHGVVWYNSIASLVFGYSVVAFANRTPGASPLSFNFSEQISGGLGPYSFQWNFGDGNTSVHADPTHEYAKHGNYTVQLNTTDSRGSLVHSNLTVNAYRRLVATLNESAATVGNDSPVNLSVSTRGGFGNFTYNWSGLPPGCRSANLSALTCSPTAPGAYVISVNVTDVNHDWSAAEQNLTVTSSPSGSNSTPLTSPSKFPTWIFAVAVVVVLALVVALFLWQRKTPPPPRKLARPPARPATAGKTAGPAIRPTPAGKPGSPVARPPAVAKPARPVSVPPPRQPT
jgi:hypothetical protein